MLLPFALNALSTLALSMVQTDAHVHGEGNLAISSDGSMLVVEFVTDQHTLFGFEGAAKTEAEELHRAQISKAVANPGALFELETSVVCTPKTVELIERGAETGLGFEDEHDHDEHEDHSDHDEHDHHAEHADHSEQAHDDHHEEHHGEDMHVDMVVERMFECAGPPSVRSIDVTAFELFPALESLRVMVLTDTQQAEHVIKRASPRVTLQ